MEVVCCEHVESVVCCEYAERVVCCVYVEIVVCCEYVNGLCDVSMQGEFCVVICRESCVL